MLTALFVTARIVANPVSNVFQKKLTQRSADPIFIIFVTHALLGLVCLPFALGNSYSTEFWINILISAALAVAGNALLVSALQISDLSMLGPINAYKAVVALLLGIVMIGEVPSLTGLAGVSLIVAGSYFVVDAKPGSSALASFFQERGVQLRFAALAVSATEAVFLKKAILASSPSTTFLWWSILGCPIAGLAALFRRDFVMQLRLARDNGLLMYVATATATGVMQCATLFTFGRLAVGYSLALFQLSTLLSIFFGYRFFDEQGIRRRLLASAVMTAGAVMIVAAHNTR